MKSMKLLASMMILLALSGCTKEPAIQIYSLDVASVNSVGSSSYKTKSVKVIYPQSIKNRISQKMHFSYSSIDRGTYQNAEWSNTMSKLLQGTFIEALDESRLFKVVLSDTSTAKEDYRLESNIFAFEHRVRDQDSDALVSIQFNLISVETGRMVKSKRFTYVEPTPTIDAKGYVIATNRALSHLNRDLVAWLR